MAESISIEQEALLAQVNWVKALARHLVQDENEADDLAQDTFLAALTSPPRKRDSLRAWLATVVRNRAVSRFRSEKRRFQREREVPKTEADGSPSSLLEKAEVHKKLVDALLSLDEPYRSVLVLRYFGELTHEQIASRQGLSRGTVGSQVQRGLVSLRRKLNGSFGSRRAWVCALGLLAGLDGKSAAAGSGPVLSLPVVAVSLAGAVLLVGGILWLFAPGSGPAGAPPGKPVAQSDEAGRETPDGAARTRSVPDRGTFSPGTGPTPELASARSEMEGDESAQEVAAPVEVLASIAGRVNDGRGNPVAGAMVRASRQSSSSSSSFYYSYSYASYSYSRSSGSSSGSTGGESATDETGRFMISDLPSGRYRLTADSVGDLESRSVSDVLALAGEETEVDLELRDGLSIEGTVIDPLGQPVAGAIVGASPRRPQGDAITATTEPDGSFRLSGLKPGNQILAVEHESWAPAQRTVVAAGSVGVEVQLRAGARIAGVVVTQNGDPVSGAGVYLTGWAARPFSGASQPNAESDESGYFVLDNVSPGRVSLRVKAEGRPGKKISKLEVPADGARTDLRVVLPRAAMVTGVVVGPDEQPVGGAEVEIEGAGDDVTRTTDSEGRFTVSGLGVGSSYRGEVTHARFPPARVERFQVSAESEELAPILLKRSHELRGRVVTADEEPLAGAEVTLLNQHHRPVSSDSAVFSDRTGEFVISRVPDGEYRLRAAAEGFATYAQESLVAVTDLASAKIVIRMGEGKTVGGRVTGESGEPVPGAKVMTRPGDATDYTDAEGQFLVRGLKGDTFQVYVSHDWYAYHHVKDVPANSTLLQVWLRKEATLRGVVFKEADRSPVREFDVSLRPEGVFRAWDRSHFIHRGGEFVLRGLTPGNYTLTVSASGHALFSVEGLQLDPGRNEPLDVPMAAGAAVRGRVVDGSGQPIRRVTVGDATGEQGSLASQLSAAGDRMYRVTASRHNETSTDGEGRFQLEGLVPGEVTLILEKRGYLQRTVQVAATRGEARTLEDITLERGARIFGEIQEDGGTPLPGGTVEIAPLDSEGRADEERTRYVQLEEGGSYSRWGLKGGRYRVRVCKRPGAERVVELDGGEEVRIDLKVDPPRE